MYTIQHDDPDETIELILTEDERDSLNLAFKEMDKAKYILKTLGIKDVDINVTCNTLKRLSNGSGSFIKSF